MNNQLKTTFIREGIKPVIPNDDVIQDGHIQQDATLFDFSGDLRNCFDIFLILKTYPLVFQ